MHPCESVIDEDTREKCGRSATRLIIVMLGDEERDVWVCDGCYPLIEDGVSLVGSDEQLEVKL